MPDLFFPSALGIFFVVILPLEWMFAMRRQKILHPEYFADVLFLVGQYVLWNGLVVFLLAWADRGLDMQTSTTLRA